MSWVVENIVELWESVLISAMIGQFFILSPRGDTIINKDFRGDGLPGMQELFFRQVSIHFFRSSMFIGLFR